MKEFCDGLGGDIGVVVVGGVFDGGGGEEFAVGSPEDDEDDPELGSPASPQAPKNNMGDRHNRLLKYAIRLLITILIFMTGIENLITNEITAAKNSDYVEFRSLLFTSTTFIFLVKNYPDNRVAI